MSTTVEINTLKMSSIEYTQLKYVPSFLIKFLAYRHYLKFPRRSFLVEVPYRGNKMVFDDVDVKDDLLFWLRGQVEKKLRLKDAVKVELWWFSPPYDEPEFLSTPEDFFKMWDTSNGDANGRVKLYALICERGPVVGEINASSSEIRNKTKMLALNQNYLAKKAALQTEIIMSSESAAPWRYGPRNAYETIEIDPDMASKRKKGKDKVFYKPNIQTQLASVNLNQHQNLTGIPSRTPGHNGWSR